MKSIIPLLAITILAALTLVGCNQNSSPTNSSGGDTNNVTGGITNPPANNSMPAITNK